MGVDEKQFVAHLCTLCQKVLSLVREPALGVKVGPVKKDGGDERRCQSVA